MILWARKNILFMFSRILNIKVSYIYIIICFFYLPSNKLTSLIYFLVLSFRFGFGPCIFLVSKTWWWHILYIYTLFQNVSILLFFKNVVSSTFRNVSLLHIVSVSMQPRRRIKKIWKRRTRESQTVSLRFVKPKISPIVNNH